MEGNGGRMMTALFRRVTALADETAACVRFFSRMPIPRLSASDDPQAVPDFRRISRAIPIAGLIVALPAAVAGWLLGMSGLPALATGFIVTGLLAAVTGALHEDGLGDVADGFFGGHTRERRLEIMKDSRIGAFGALTLVVATGLKAALISALLTRFGPGGAMILLLASEAFSRALLVWQWQRLPSARPEGLAARFGKPDLAATGQAALFGAACLGPGFFVVSASSLLLGLMCSGVTALAVARLAMTKIGGATGDVLGAIQQTAALAFLAGLLLIP